MEYWKLYNDVENRTFEIQNSKELVYAKKQFLKSLFSDKASVINQIDIEHRTFLINMVDTEFIMEDQFKQFEAAKQLIFKLSSKDEEIIKDIKKKWNLYEDELKKASVTDNLEQYLSEQKETTYYYIGINKFVEDYYKNNPNSEWKIKAILQLGFPFEFAEPKIQDDFEILVNLRQSFLKKKKWSLFIFSKESFDKVTIGFDDRNTFANLEYIQNKRYPDVCGQKEELPDDYKGTPFAACDYYNDDLYWLINSYLNNYQIPKFTNDERKELNYSFTEIPVEYFRLDYLDYLSRYKQSVIDVFGYPDKKEKIRKLSSVVQFINAPGKKKEYPDYEERKQNVLIKDFFFHNRNLVPIVRIGVQNIDAPTFWEEYEIHSYMKNITPAYLYCLLSSELIKDYYSDRYTAEKYYDEESPLPLEDCIYIDIPAEKMDQKKYSAKYERDMNPRLKVHNMIDSKSLNTADAKESIDNYLIEIKNDIDVGSYYSATILMGSVLEAFLIDWLSEIDGKNYFKEDYLVTEEIEDEETGKKVSYQRKASFYDYINIIQRKRPDWIDGAKKATEIRKTRNLVHAKLYIEKGTISQEVCYEMLKNLEVIINNRWNRK